MFTIDFENLTLELKDGAIKHVGARNKAAAAKLFHVTSASARAFGDSQVKLEFADDEGNAVEIALDPDQAEAVVDDVDRLREEGPVFE